MGVFRQCYNARSGLRRGCLLLVYKSYVRPVLQFGCSLFSGLPNYRLYRLFILKRQALRLCLGLPKCVANNALYCQTRVPFLHTRFRYLTLSVYLIFYNPPVLYSTTMTNILHADFFSAPERVGSRGLEILFVNNLLASLGLSLTAVTKSIPLNAASQHIHVSVVDISQRDGRRLPITLLVGQLKDVLSTYFSRLLIAIDASVRHENAGAGGFYIP